MMLFGNKKNSSQILTLLVFGIVLFLVMTLMMPKQAKYMPGKSIKVSGPREGSLFDLPVGLDCVAGPSQTASPYSLGLTPGGICGAQEFVANQSEYVIEDEE